MHIRILVSNKSSKKAEGGFIAVVEKWLESPTHTRKAQSSRLAEGLFFFFKGQKYFSSYVLSVECIRYRINN